MSLVSAVPAVGIYTGYSDLRNQGINSRSIFADLWEQYYHLYGKAGDGQISSGEANAGIIYSGFMSLDTYQSSNVDKLANMFAQYWSTSHLTPKAPAVVIIGNDALTRVSQFKAAILQSYKTTDTQPYFKHFIDNIESVVTSIIWTGLDNNGATIVGGIA